MVLACNPSTQEAEARKPQIQNQPGKENRKNKNIKKIKQSQPGYLVRLCLK
jgi:hypothetical protein